ncbi:hypothetical protein [Paraburkholderia sp. BCC1886]|uniref:hypothetical protein n=1 Tax=Paraburkholderia sp. BCC1886 TaxID=2562670 RepID=UPI00118201B5|nr:hypothetical protein [Paraburkholderia sp. BCC1886]
MWVRAVATAAAALAVWCVSGAATAANYAEVWNPPEAAAHHAKAGTGKKSVSAKHASSKLKTRAHGKTPQKVAAVPGRGRQATAHGSVKKTSAESAGKGAVKGATAGDHAGRSKSHGKAPLVVQTNKRDVRIAKAKAPVQGSRHTTSLAKNPNAKSYTLQAGTPSAAHKPLATYAAATSRPATAGPGDSPATANSGSLPPILH